MTGMDRWKLFREVIRNRRSGSLVLQIGQKYVTWAFTSGELGWISSTHPDYTLTQFLLKNGDVSSQAILKAQEHISDVFSLGALLVRSGAANMELLTHSIALHAAWLSHLLLQTTTHIFWSDTIAQAKQEFIVSQGIPFSRILLSCDRSAVEVRSAVQFAGDMPERYRVDGWDFFPGTLLPLEKRLLPYLKRGASIDEILGDPELDRMTCYRTLFLLWVAGRLNPIPPPPASRSEAMDSSPTIWQRLRTIPPDWIVPLALGAILGTAMSPDPPPPPDPQPPMEQLDRAFERPAWTTNSEYESQKAPDGESMPDE